MAYSAIVNNLRSNLTLLINQADHDECLRTFRQIQDIVDSANTLIAEKQATAQAIVHNEIFWNEVHREAQLIIDQQEEAEAQLQQEEAEARIFSTPVTHCCSRCPASGPPSIERPWQKRPRKSIKK
jgi:hypothetical protein